jgi:hypothetical protein
LKGSPSPIAFPPFFAQFDSAPGIKAEFQSASPQGGATYACG